MSERANTPAPLETPILPAASHNTRVPESPGRSVYDHLGSTILSPDACPKTALAIDVDPGKRLVRAIRLTSVLLMADLIEVLMSSSSSRAGVLLVVRPFRLLYSSSNN